MYNHLLDVESLTDDELLEKILEISNKISKAAQAGYSNQPVFDSMLTVQHMLREEFTARSMKNKLKIKEEDKTVEIGEIKSHE